MSSETTGSRPGRRIDVPSVPNLRDIGGYAVTGGGPVKMGQLYRSVELSHLHGDDLAAMAQFGIRTVFDLRTAAEREAEPDMLPPGAEQIVCDVLADEKSAAPATLFKVLGDPTAAREMLGGGKDRTGWAAASTLTCSTRCSAWTRPTCAPRSTR